MILADKIKLLRKEQGCSQEWLAEQCGVSRQAISKWEADITLPETDKLILLSNLFKVSIDALLKDNLEIDEVKDVPTCGIRNKVENDSVIYQGVLIKESICDELILDYISVDKVELWKTDGTPKYWTALYFTSKKQDFPEILSKVVLSNEEVGNWFVDMKSGDTKIIVFKNKIFKYKIGNVEEKEQVCKECRKLGIPDNQMNWKE
jgi:transcriptional regulator with XRE-family HTH domain